MAPGSLTESDGALRLAQLARGNVGPEAIVGVKKAGMIGQTGRGRRLGILLIAVALLVINFLWVRWEILSAEVPTAPAAPRAQRPRFRARSAASLSLRSRY